jgi:hypothetical protein
VGGIISFWWATSFRYDGRHHLVLVGDFDRNQHVVTWFILALLPTHPQIMLRDGRESRSRHQKATFRFELSRGYRPVVG